MVGTLLSASCDAKIDWKALSRRIGHADVAFTMKQYVQTDLEADRQVATTLAQLIIGGSRSSTEITDQARADQGVKVSATPVKRPEPTPRLQIRLQTPCERPSLCLRNGLWPW
jgi:hypothetical protein